MKWKKGRVGAERTIHRFAFLPTHLDDGYVVWLEIYAVNQHLGIGQLSGKIKWFETSTEVIDHAHEYSGGGM